MLSALTLTSLGAQKCKRRLSPTVKLLPLSVANFYRRFIRDYPTIVTPLTQAHQEGDVVASFVAAGCVWYTQDNGCGVWDEGTGARLSSFGKRAGTEVDEMAVMNVVNEPEALRRVMGRKSWLTME